MVQTDTTSIPADSFDAAIFDCDGTLADTMPLHYEAWREALAARGAEISEALFYELGGVPTERIVAMLNERQGYALPVVQTAIEKEARYEELLPRIRPVERVVSLVRAYHGRYPMAVASGGIRRLVLKTVEALDLRDCFAAVLTAEDVARPKPAPDLFLLAAERLGARPDRCVVYEDSDLGLEAARLAGMQAVDVRPWLERGRGDP